MDGDRLEGSPLGDAATAVADRELDVGDRQRGQRFAGAEGQRRVALDADHLGRQQREHAGGVAGAGPDLEHPLGAAQRQRLADRGDDPGLGDRLLLGDRQGRVVVGAVPQARRHERLSRHLSHRRQHPLVGDAAAAQLPLHHPRPEAGEVCHA